MESKILTMEPLVGRVQSWPVSIQACLGVIILGLVYSFLTGDRPYAGLPIAEIEQKGINALIRVFLPSFSWMMSPKEVIAKGKEISKASDGIYQVRASGGYKIVLPRRYAEEIRNSEHMTFMGSVKKDFQATQPGFEGMLEGTREDNLIIDAIHKMSQSLGVLLQPMVEEAELSVSRWFGDVEEEWRSFGIKETLVDIIARIATRVFAGPDLARNEDWVRIARDHTVSSFISAVILHQVPALLRPLLVWVIPECRKLRKQVAEAKQIMAPEVREIEQRLRDGERRTTTDGFTWLIDVAKGRPINFILAQLNFSEASIHTTSEVFTRIMMQLCKTPELVNDLREEIVCILEEEGGWSKTVLYKMKLLDSFMKEVSRDHPMSVAGMLRDVKRDVKLSNGVLLPAGGLVMVEDDGYTDPDVNPQPEKFDAYRYLRLRQQPDGEAQHQFVTTTPDNLVFGYGNHQCPGRQLAANEIKITLSFMLLRYDWRFEPGYNVPESIKFESRIAAPDARIQCRRRRDEPAILNVMKAT